MHPFLDSTLGLFRSDIADLRYAIFLTYSKRYSNFHDRGRYNYKISKLMMYTLFQCKNYMERWTFLSFEQISRLGSWIHWSLSIGRSVNVDHSKASRSERTRGWDDEYIKSYLFNLRYEAMFSNINIVWGKNFNDLVTKQTLQFLLVYRSTK